MILGAEPAEGQGEHHLVLDGGVNVVSAASWRSSGKGDGKQPVLD